MLKKRYANPVGSYQHIPADVHGDCGIEGFAVDGTAYQCYAAQNCLNSNQLLVKQRNKMTRDIATFISKEAELLKILGDIKIGIWNFVLLCGMPPPIHTVAALRYLSQKILKYPLIWRAQLDTFDL